ncbi:MAG: tetratricopeptide repeat protein [Anaerolineaceae bacterium]|jgi:tetratricopeptide (TPR) repeat protein|nr:tetratricopeptide repeat protein [Anaerolineaceae bacterium]
MSGDQQAFLTAMNQGHSAAWDQNWSDAVNHYRTALQEVPDDPMALISIGLALLEMQDFEGALMHYQKVSSISTNDPLPYEKMAYIYESMGRIKDAVKMGMQAAEMQLRAKDVDKSIESWQHVISLEPDNLIARTRLAMIYDKMGKKTEAAGEYLAAASLMQSAGDNQKAIQAVRYCLQIAPDNIDVQNAMKLLKSNHRLPKPEKIKLEKPMHQVRLANIQQLQTGQTAELELKMDPVAETRQSALEELATMLFDSTDNDASSPGKRSIAALTRGTGGLSLEQSERTRILLHLGHAIDLQSGGNEKRAAEELQRVLDIGLEKTSVYFTLGLFLLDDNPQKAIKYLNNALRRREYAIASYLLIGKINESQDNLQDATTAYLQAYRLADLMTVPEKFVDELKQLYEPILEAQQHETNPKNLLAVCQNVRSQLMRADWREYLQKARAQMPAVSEDNPPVPLIEMLLQSRSGQVVEALANVRELSQRGFYRSATEEAFHALQFAPTYMPLHIQIGELLAKSGQIEEAIKKYLLVAELYEVRGEPNQAIRVLKKVTEFAPMDLSIRNRLIELLSNSNQIDEAIHEYLEVGEIHYRLAELDKARQSYLLALRLAQQSRTNRKWAVQILTKIADIDMQRLDWRQALRIFEQLRSLQPEDKAARVQLIDINVRLGQLRSALKEIDDFVKILEEKQKTKEVVQFLNELIKEHPEEIEIRKRLMDAFIRYGHTSKAIKQMDEMADRLLDKGDKRGAIEMVEAIIAMNPPNSNQYRQLLQQIKTDTKAK